MSKKRLVPNTGPYKKFKQLHNKDEKPEDTKCQERAFLFFYCCLENKKIDDSTNNEKRERGCCIPAHLFYKKKSKAFDCSKSKDASKNSQSGVSDMDHTRHSSCAPGTTGGHDEDQS
jgi:hypothetical protein